MLLGGLSSFRVWRSIMTNLPYRFALACGLTILLGLLALGAAAVDLVGAALPPAYNVPRDLDAGAQQILRRQYDRQVARLDEQRPWTYGLAGARIVLGLSFVAGGALAWQGQALGRHLLVPAYAMGFFFVALATIVLVGEAVQRSAICLEHYEELVAETTLDQHRDRALALAYAPMPYGGLEIAGTVVLLVGKVLCFVVGLGYFTRNDVRAYLEPGPAWMYQRRPVAPAT